MVVPRILRKSRKLFSLIRDSFFRRALIRDGVAAGIEHAPLLRAQKFSVIVDVGANRGQFSLAARRWQPSARIVAFEPLPTPAEVFRRLFAADKLTVLHEVAIAPVIGEAIIHVSRRDDSSSLLPISKLQTKHYPGTEAITTARVRTAPLTNFLAPPELAGGALLKIDVQGFELDVLASSTRLLPYFDCVYLEASFVPLYEGQALADRIIAFLEQRAFRLTGVFNVSEDHRTGLALQADFLFAMDK
jgi:FkbM family methyltransferase